MINPYEAQFFSDFDPAAYRDVVKLVCFKSDRSLKFFHPDEIHSSEEHFRMMRDLADKIYERYGLEAAFVDADKRKYSKWLQKHNILDAPNVRRRYMEWLRGTES